MGGLIVFGDMSRSVPEDFRQKLQSFDPDLLVGFDGRRQRWKMEQCVRHLAPGAEHSHLCERIYVWLLQTPEGDYLGLENWEGIREKLRSIDTREQGYSPDAKGLERYRADSAYLQEWVKRKQDWAMAQVPRLYWKDNWLTHNRLVRQLEKHGVDVLLDSTGKA